MFSYQLTVNRNQLIIMEDCSVIINYGLKKEYFELNKDNKIRWQRNVIITKNNMNHYNL